MHHCRQLSKFCKLLIVIVLYFAAYVTIVCMAPKPMYSFVSDDIRVGNKYVLVYLVGGAPAMSDAEGADVFRGRRCGACFITNNKGFLPLTQYDAVVVAGPRRLLADAAAFMEPEKRYLMEASPLCLQNKLLGCYSEPRLTSFATRDNFDLCGLCRHLHEKRKMWREEPPGDH
ncbi:uncharacterized protein LOC126374736 [Pectinophora gossypiella]|uniref:uncharacterized protein LOC126374736 n=1 Tax=Pectinophora gossypiella TaxID=13191 RepID=UPI00214E6391|nr:uncharacterized protein LOC126374736 [Pectinophora gossypiella]